MGFYSEFVDFIALRVSWLPQFLPCSALALLAACRPFAFAFAVGEIFVFVSTCLAPAFSSSSFLLYFFFACSTESGLFIHPISIFFVPFARTFIIVPSVAKTHTQTHTQEEGSTHHQHTLAKISDLLSVLCWPFPMCLGSIISHILLIIIAFIVSCVFGCRRIKAK